MGVSDWFQIFNSKILLSKDELSTISARYKNITKRINKDYYNSDSEVNNSYYVGSFGRDTEIYTSDIDMLVRLPYETYKKFDNYENNGQSALLQEVRCVLKKTYSISNIKADGQIISIPFTDKINFEVLPAFKNKDGSYTFANSNNGGSWKVTDPLAEINAVNKMNNECNKNLKRLCRMARSWKVTNNVPISGMLIDVLAYKFINDWSFKDKSYFYYDYMSRDFFKYLSEQDEGQKYWLAMGSNRNIYRNGVFENKAKNAHKLCIEAINDEEKYPLTAKSNWRRIYGTKFPL